MRLLTMALCSLLISGCVATPAGVSVVKEFDLERYLGTWYEIARLDHRFERGLSRVSANYSKRTDGGIDVINRGFDSEKSKWKEAKGRAYQVGEPGDARLKVTFFWPFYAGYNVIELDRDNYEYAVVCGPDKKYLWILARDRTLAEPVLKQLVARAKQLGFDTDALIYVDQKD